MRETEALQSGNVMILYDTKTAGESSSQPNSRMPPFRTKALQTWVHAIVRARVKEDKAEDDVDFEMIPQGHLFCVLTGGRSGNDVATTSAFNSPVSGNALGKSHQEFQLFYTQQSLHKRKERVRGFVNCAETLHVYTKDVLDMPLRNRLHFPEANNHGTVIGPFSLATYDSPDCWRVMPSVKKLCLGSTGKILVGGAGPTDAVAKPKFEDGEPMSWHLMCREVYEELFHSFASLFAINYLCFPYFLIQININKC